MQPSIRRLGIRLFVLATSASPALLAQGEPPPTGELPPLEPAPAPAAAPPPTAPAPAPAPASAAAPPAAYAPPPAPVHEPPPPPPERPPSEGFEMPHFSVRVDPFNWLLRGLLGFELEVQTPIKFMTVELVPVFVVNEQPPVLSLSGREDVLSRQSDGIGALAGTSIGLGFWLKGEPFEDYVLRAVFTNYGYGYQATDSTGAVFDQVTHVERHFYGMFSSFSRFGPFTIAGGIGLGVELNKEKRCFVLENNRAVPTRDCRDQELLIKLDPDANNVADLSGGLGGVQIVGRISLGASF